jgi:hypothetical protein
MISDTDLPSQLDSHQQLPQMETEVHLGWKAFFILLVTINVIFFGYIGMALNQTYVGVAAIGIIPIALILVLIDLFAILFYMRKQHPQGIARVISYAALILITLLLLPIIINILSIVFLIVI